MKHIFKSIPNVYFSIMLMFCMSLSAQHQMTSSGHEWTWLFHKKFSEQELYGNAAKKEVSFLKHGVPNFSQLLFSWNAFRPHAGYFSFSVQVRDAKRKQWGMWHKMAEWGAGIQRSFSQTADSLSQYHFVRLELDKSKHADALRIKIEAHDGASLKDIRSLAMSLSDMRKFKHETIDRSYESLASIYIPNVPRQSQMTVSYKNKQSICSPTSCGMLVSFLKNKHIDYLSFVKHAYDHGLGVHGSWPFNTAHAFEQCKGNVFFSVGRLPSFKHLHERLLQGIPIVVSVRGEISGAPQAYNNGHLMLVIGWDAKRQLVICHDPAEKNNDAVLKKYSLSSFIRAWERSHRLVYLAEPLKKGKGIV